MIKTNKKLLMSNLKVSLVFRVKLIKLYAYLLLYSHNNNYVSSTQMPWLNLTLL